MRDDLTPLPPKGWVTYCVGHLPSQRDGNPDLDKVARDLYRLAMQGKMYLAQWRDPLTGVIHYMARKPSRKRLAGIDEVRRNRP